MVVVVEGGLNAALRGGRKAGRLASSCSAGRAYRVGGAGAANTGVAGDDDPEAGLGLVRSITVVSPTGLTM